MWKHEGHQFPTLKLHTTGSKPAIWILNWPSSKYFSSICWLKLFGMCFLFIVLSELKIKNRGFPGGAVVKNPPANAGDMGSSPGPGRSHMPRSNQSRAPQLLSLHSRAREPQLLSPRATTTEACVPRACAPQQEKPLQWEAHAPQRRVAPARRNQRKPARSNEDPTQPKINK